MRARQHHEEFAIDAIASAKRELAHTHRCDPGAVYATVRAHRDIARARVHLDAIGGGMGGGREGTRTRKLWTAVSKVERQVEKASDRVAACLLRR